MIGGIFILIIQIFKIQTILHRILSLVDLTAQNGLMDLQHQVQFQN